jgi:predicted nucleic acid-binding protein
MNGIGLGTKMAKPKYILDSSIAIDLLNGSPSSKSIRAKLENAKVYISVITRIEMLSFPNITADIEKKIYALLKSVRVISFNKKVEQNTILIRRSKKLKIPDSIIAATALTVQAAIISRDDHFNQLSWPGLSVIAG